MTLGNHTVRSGPDTRVLAGSVLRRLQYDAAGIAQRIPGAAPPAAPAGPESLLRKVVKWGYQRLKPLVRPITRRARAYINRPLEDRLDRIERLLAEHLAASGTPAFTRALSPLTRRMAAVDERLEELTSLVQAHSPQRDGARTIDPVISQAGPSSPASARPVAEAGDLERGTRLLIERLLRPGEVVVEVGANPRLEDLLPTDRSVQLLKIDVEAGEAEGVEGARRVLRDHPGAGLIVGFGRSRLRATGKSTASWLQAFRALGLECRAIHPEDGSLRECRAADLERFDTIDLFFAQPGKDAWQRVVAAA